jgi:hypothetical protein
MIGLFIILILSLFLLLISYQAFRYRRTYWMWPTISGFKQRNSGLDPKGFSYFVGFISLVLGLFFLFLFVKGFFI